MLRSSRSRQTSKAADYSIREVLAIVFYCLTFPCVKVIEGNCCNVCSTRTQLLSHATERFAKWSIFYVGRFTNQKFCSKGTTFSIFNTENCSESVESEIYSSVICFVNTLLFSAQCSVQCYIISPFPF